MVRVVICIDIWKQDNLLIRDVTVADAAALATLFTQLDNETAFMAMGDPSTAAELTPVR